MVKLKKVSPGDGPLLVMWRNENKEYFGTQEDISLSSHDKWYQETYLYDPYDQYFMVVSNGMLVGTISLNSLSAEVGRVLLGDKQYAHQGIMSEALALVGDLTSKRLWLRVLKNNVPAIRFYERNGFSIKRTSYTYPVMWVMENENR